MPLSELVTEATIHGSLRAGTKAQAFDLIARRIGSIYQLDSGRILSGLNEREELGTTSVGHGIAIPHAKLPNIQRIIGFFARLERPIAFGALDEEPVDLIFALIAPEHAGADHLRALANVARILRNPVMAANLRATTEVAALYTLLVRAERSHAA